MTACTVSGNQLILSSIPICPAIRPTLECTQSSHAVGTRRVPQLEELSRTLANPAGATQYVPFREPSIAETPAIFVDIFRDKIDRIRQESVLIRLASEDSMLGNKTNHIRSEHDLFIRLFLTGGGGW